MEQIYINNNRIKWIDWAKSVCMFLVILGHCHIQKHEGIGIQLIYSFHIQLFFFLSGTLCKRAISISSLKKDFNYLIIPYLTFGILTIFCDTIRAKSIQTEVLMFQMKDLLTGYHTYIGPYWFLLSMFICKQLFLLIKMTKEYSNTLYYLIASLTFIPAYFIYQNHYNLIFFADSAFFGLPFFILGNECLRLIEKLQNKAWQLRLTGFVLLCILSYYLSKANGFVSIAGCITGNSILLYYTNSITAIFAVILLCTIVCRFLESTFITVTSYGTIATLGCHSLFLTLLYYYIPKLLGITTMSYSWPTGILFSIITYAGCYILIIYLDKYIPKPFGLKGNLLKLLHPKKISHLPFVY